MIIYITVKKDCKLKSTILKLLRTRLNYSGRFPGIILRLTFKNCFARILKVGEKSINYIIYVVIS